MLKGENFFVNKDNFNLNQMNVYRHNSFNNFYQNLKNNDKNSQFN